MTLGKLLGTVVTCVELNQVAVLVVVCGTCCETNLALWQRREHIIYKDVGVILVDVPEEHTRNGVVAEASVVVEVCLSIVAAVAGILTRVAEHRLRRVALRSLHVGIGAVFVLGIVLQLVMVVVERAESGTLRPVLEREHQVEAQTLGNEVELLVEVQVGIDGTCE